MDEVTVIDGRQWHRNHAAWEGQRVSFVAFTSSDFQGTKPEELERLEALGFRPPSAEFLKTWRGPEGTGAEGNWAGRPPGEPLAGPEEGAGFPPRPKARPAPKKRSTSEPVRKGAQTFYKT